MKQAQIVKNIQSELFSRQDLSYRELQVKIIPNIEADSIIGVRTPELRKLAKELLKREDLQEFLDVLPHKYFDENQLHAFIISEIKDYDRCISEVERFLPFVDNWATCDQMSPKVFKKHRPELLKKIKQWIKAEKTVKNQDESGNDSPSDPSTYTIRFGIGMLMQHFLDEDFDPSYPELVAVIRSEEYYVNMMIAWYFATALAKQYETVLPFIRSHRLDTWTHNKAIRKSVESYRITPEQKEYLKSLKIKK